LVTFGDVDSSGVFVKPTVKRLSDEAVRSPHKHKHVSNFIKLLGKEHRSTRLLSSTTNLFARLDRRQINVICKRAFGTVLSSRGFRHFSRLCMKQLMNE